MKDLVETEDEFLKEKREDINKIISLIKFNKEELLQDQYRNGELFKEIKKLAISKGGFLDNSSRKKLWEILFYKIKARKSNKKNIIDVIKINEDIKVNILELNLLSQKKELL